MRERDRETERDREREGERERQRGRESKINARLVSTRRHISIDRRTYAETAHSSLK